VLFRLKKNFVFAFKKEKKNFYSRGTACPTNIFGPFYYLHTQVIKEASEKREAAHDYSTIQIKLRVNNFFGPLIFEYMYFF